MPGFEGNIFSLSPIIFKYKNIKHTKHTLDLIAQKQSTNKYVGVFFWIFFPTYRDFSKDILRFVSF